MRIFYSDYKNTYFNPTLGKVAGLPPKKEQGYEFADFIISEKCKDIREGGDTAFEPIVCEDMPKCFYDGLIQGLIWRYYHWHEDIVLKDDNPDISAYFTNKVRQLYGLE